MIVNLAVTQDGYFMYPCPQYVFPNAGIVYEYTESGYYISTKSIQEDEDARIIDVYY